MLHQTIKDSIKDAMKARDEVRLSVLRSLVTAFTNELVATKRKPDEMLSDEEVLSVIRRSVKQHKESVDQFRKGGREDLVAAEEAELKILEAYLPALMSREDIKKIARAKKDELGIIDKAQVGKLMSAIMQELKGKADGADVKAVVESLF